MHEDMLLDGADDGLEDDTLDEPLFSSDASQDSLTTQMFRQDEGRPGDTDDILFYEPLIENSLLADINSVLPVGALSEFLLGNVDEATPNMTAPICASPGLRPDDALLADVADQMLLDRTDLPAVASGRNDREKVIDRIEDLLTSAARSLKSSIAPQIACRHRRQEDTLLISAPSTREPLRYISFPGANADEAWRFTVVLRILDMLHEALMANVTVSKRDIYYKAPSLFGKQSMVDKYIDDIACTFGVPRAALNVTAAAKGLAIGSFKVIDRNGALVEHGSSNEGILIRTLEADEIIEIPDVDIVLVIEKEATFRSLTSSALWQSSRERAIMLTAKGYPDIATRAFLRLLVMPTSRNSFRSPAAYCLVDYDPDGLAIYSTYRDGSRALAHENEHLAVPALKRIGLKADDFRTLLSNENVADAGSLLRLTRRDRSKATRMLQRQAAMPEVDIEICRDLQTMLMLNAKCEMQALELLQGKLSDWLTDALHLSAMD